MSTEKNTPEIRFKGFSDEWKSKTIAELIDDELIYPPKDGNHGNLHPKATDYVQYGIPFVMANNIRGGKIQFRDCYHISLDQAATLQKGFTKVNDVLLTHKGTVGEVAIVPKTVFPYLMLTPQVTYYRILDTSRLDKYFLAFSFVTNRFQAPLKQESGGGTRAYLGITAQQKLSISIPTKFEEQAKIGNIFQKLDSLINQHQQKHDKLSNIKKALLEKMFPKQGETIPEIRFKGFSGDWEERELDSVTQVTMGQSPSGENYTNNANDFILVQGNADLKNGFVVPRVWTSEVTKIAFKGALIFSVRAPVGEVGKTNYDVVLGRGVAAVYGNEFIYQQLQKLKSDNYWHKVSAGSTFDAISSSELASTLIWISSELEQEKIGHYFQKLDTLINQHQQQITKLNNIKQACLKKMFV